MDKKIVVLAGAALVLTGVLVLRSKLGKDNRENDLWAAASDQPS
jgi:hypothetical protein